MTITKAYRVDSNQKRITRFLRQLGASVQVLSYVGRGCPDLLVGFRGKNYLFELKDGNKPKSKQKLTPDEESFIKKWAGEVSVVCNEEEILNLLI